MMYVNFILIIIFKIPTRQRKILSIVVKLFGRAFQIYDDVINLVEKNFGNMKNGLGEDITEGKISYPIVYCFSKYRGRKNSVTMINPSNDLIQNNIMNTSLDKEKTINSDPEDLLDFVNNSNIYSIQNKQKNNSTDNDQVESQDMNLLVEILKEKTKDKERISKAIKILKSKGTKDFINKKNMKPSKPDLKNQKNYSMK